MNRFALLLALALLASGCTAARQTHAPSTSAAHAISCYDDWALAINRFRTDGVTRAQLAETLPAHAPQTARMTQLIAYLYDGPQRTHYEATQYAQQLCHEARDQPVAVPQTVERQPSRFWPTVGTVAAGVALVGLGVTASALANSHTYTSTHTYKTSSGFRTIRTSCYYGRYHSSCTTR